MTFVFRLVLALLVFSFVVYVFKALTRLSHHIRGTAREVRGMRDRLNQSDKVSAEMVRCQACGAFVATSDAVQLRLGKKSLVFCSELCLNERRVKA